MTTYTDQDKEHALNLYTQHGATHAANETGISRRTILRWANDAGLVSQANQEKTTQARAAAAEKVATEWADFRSGEAVNAGASAANIRSAIRNRVAAGDPRGVRDLAVAYGIMIDKAELLSGHATERVETWAESDVDRELREAITMFDRKVNAT